MGNKSSKAGVPPPGPITEPKSQGAAQCCAIPGRFCCTIFYAIAGGFGFRLGADAAQSMVNAL